MSPPCVLQVQECIITFFIQPWVKTQEVSDFKCGASKAYQAAAPVPAAVVEPESVPLLGGVDMADPAEEGVKAAAMFAVEEMNTRSNSLYRTVLLDITHVTKQVGTPPLFTRQK